MKTAAALTFCSLFALSCAASSSVAPSAAPSAAPSGAPAGANDEGATRPPNVLLIITDDQGYGDLGCHGNTMIRTPALDQLYAESARLTNFHVDPTCAPTRSALMSGRYSTRTGVWHTIMGRSLMNTDEVTIAERFQDAGYRTGLFGKWHLGDNYPMRPEDQGFERVVWHKGGGLGQGPDYWGNDYFDDTYLDQGEWRAFDGYCTDVWFQEAERFIQEDDDRPFFAYLSTNAPHGPYLVDPAYAQPYLDAGVSPQMSNFYGMIENIDENVGQLRAQLSELGLADNTILIFMSDNGTAAGHAPGRMDAEAAERVTWNGYRAGMRGNKGSEYEGGHRVPLFVYWPEGGVKAGVEIDRLTAHVDVLPTVMELCGIPLDGSEALDGSSLAGPLRGSGEVGERTLFVHSQRVETPVKWRKSAVMTDRWRLVNGKQLFDLDADPEQRTDVAEAHPEVVALLRADYDVWWDSLAPAREGIVRIVAGGLENPVELMSHDWHPGEGRTPWHQNHVRNGAVATGYWAVRTESAGTYEITLRRWPAHLSRAMGMQAAAIELRGTDGEVIRRSTELSGDATSASFTVELPQADFDLWTTLRRPDGVEQGAYFTSIRRL